MTPAVDLVKKAKIEFKIHQYSHDASAKSYGLEAAEKLQIDSKRVFKTLIVNLDNGELATAVIAASSSLNMKYLAKAAGCKKASMAEKSQVERTTGYLLGGISPLGQKKRLATFIDASASTYSSLFISAGRRGLEIELSPDDLVELSHGEYAELCQ